MLRGQPVSRLPSLAFALQHSWPCMRDASATYFVLNPSGDLASTQKHFEPLFAAHKSWTGVAGQPPDAATVGVQKAAILFPSHPLPTSWLQRCSRRTSTFTAATALAVATFRSARR